MYNVELKERFLETASSKSNYITCFNNFESIEEKLDKDLCQMTRDEIAAHFLDSGGVELPTAVDYVKYLNKYRRWCHQYSVMPQTNDQEVDAIRDLDYTGKLKVTTYSSFKEVYEELCNTGYKFDNGNEAAPTLALAWLGLTTDEAVELKENQVDLNAGVIADDNGTVYVSIDDPYILSVLHAYKNAWSVERNYNGGQAFQVPTGYFIHKTRRPNEHKEGPVKRQQVNRKIREANKSGRLSAKNVRTSGMMFRMRQADTNHVDFKSTHGRETVMQIFQCKENKIPHYLAYYEQYKKAFNLV